MRLWANMNSPIIIRLEREATDRPWGFRLQGDDFAEFVKGHFDHRIFFVFCI